MVFALLVVVLGAVVLAGWAQLLATRTSFSDAADLGYDRQTTLDNARAIARQHILSNMPSGTVPATNTTMSTPWGNRTIVISNGSANCWTGGHSIPYTNAGAIYTNVNPFSPMERKGYFISVGARLPDGSTNADGSTNYHPWTFIVRSRSPVVAGFGYVLQNAGTNYTATNLPVNYINFRSGTNGSNIFGSYSNIPQVPMTSTTNAGAGSYNGTFALPPSTIATGDTNFSYGYVSNTLTSNAITLILDPTNTTAILRYDVPATIVSSTNRRLTNSGGTVFTNNTHNVVAVRIQSSSTTNTFHIISTNGTNMTNLVLCGTNNARRIYFYRAGNSTLNLTTTNTQSASWRLGMTLSNTPLAISYASSRTLTMVGGIRCDSQISISSGSVTVTNSMDNANLDDVADRTMWLEDYQTPE